MLKSKWLWIPICALLVLGLGWAAYILRARMLGDQLRYVNRGKQVDVITLRFEDPVPAVPVLSPMSSNGSKALFEPDEGCYLGAYVDLDPSLKDIYKDANGKVHRLPGEFEKLAGKSHAMYFFYMGYGTKTPIDWLKRLAKEGKFVHIALEPNEGLGKVKDDQYLHDMARDIKASGAKVFLRFASEMNGAWPVYGGDPGAYIVKFQMVAKVMHDEAPNVAMVWCPYTTPKATVEEYYPGDEAVDWVGVNMYSVTYFSQDKSKPARKVRPADMLKFVYNHFAAKKPMMICEYGATHYSKVDDKNESEFAVSCIDELYSELRTQFKRIKAINYFNTNNMLLGHRKNNDYSLTGDPQVMAAYGKAIADPYFLSAIPKEPEFSRAQVEGVLPGAKASVVLPSGMENSEVRFEVNGQPSKAKRLHRTWATTLDYPVGEKLVVKAEVMGKQGKATASVQREVVVVEPKMAAATK